MSFQFPSSEWTTAFCREINASSAYADAAKTWEGDLSLVIEGEGAVYLDLWHGQCRGAEYVEAPATRAAEFAISGSAEQWTAVLQGDLDPIQALVTRRLRLDGNLVKIMKHVKAARELVNCATRVPSQTG
jgi:putative sterol carrier protein